MTTEAGMTADGMTSAAGIISTVATVTRNLSMPRRRYTSSHTNRRASTLFCRSIFANAGSMLRTKTRYLRASFGNGNMVWKKKEGQHTVLLFCHPLGRHQEGQGSLSSGYGSYCPSKKVVQTPGSPDSTKDSPLVPSAISVRANVSVTFELE